MLERHQEKLAGVVLNVNDTQTDTLYLIEKLGIRETIWRVLEEVARQPIMVGNVVILREESAPNPWAMCCSLIGETFCPG